MNTSTCRIKKEQNENILSNNKTDGQHEKIFTRTTSGKVILHSTRTNRTALSDVSNKIPAQTKNSKIVKNVKQKLSIPVSINEVEQSRIPLKKSLILKSTILQEKHNSNSNQQNSNQQNTNQQNSNQQNTIQQNVENSISRMQRLKNIKLGEKPSLLIKKGNVKKIVSRKELGIASHLKNDIKNIKKPLIEKTVREIIEEREKNSTRVLASSILTTSTSTSSSILLNNKYNNIRNNEKIKEHISLEKNIEHTETSRSTISMKHFSSKEIIEDNEEDIKENIPKHSYLSKEISVHSTSSSSSYIESTEENKSNRSSKEENQDNSTASSASSTTSTNDNDNKTLKIKTSQVEEINEINSTKLRDDEELKKDLQEWEDLDAEEVNDPSMVTEYVNEIFEYMKVLEKSTLPNPRYMDHQEKLTWKMRTVLIDWLIDIHNQFKLNPETLYLAVNIVDRFLSSREVDTYKLQLVGVTAMFIAAKYEEIVAPSVQNYLCVQDLYNENEILRAERYVLKALDFGLHYPNPMSFLRRTSKADNYDPLSRTFAKFLMELSLIDHRFLSFTPSKIAAASMYLSRLILDRGEWDANMCHYSGYTEEELSDCVDLMLLLLLIPKKKFPSIQLLKKYESKKYMKASLHITKWVSEHITLIEKRLSPKYCKA